MKSKNYNLKCKKENIFIAEVFISEDLPFFDGHFENFKDSYTIYCKSDKREYVASFIVLSDENADEEEMRKYLKDYLKGYFEKIVIPKKIYFTDLIPRNEMGKIERKQLDAIMEKIEVLNKSYEV